MKARNDRALHLWRPRGYVVAQNERVPNPPRTVFVKMAVMGDDFAIFRHRMLCIIRRKLGGLLSLFWVGSNKSVYIDDQVPNTLFKGWRWDLRMSSSADIAVTR